MKQKEKEENIEINLVSFCIDRRETFATKSIQKIRGGVRGREVEHRPRNHKVLSSSPGSGSQLRDLSLARSFGASTGVHVVPRKQNREVNGLPHMPIQGSSN